MWHRLDRVLPGRTGRTEAKRCDVCGDPLSGGKAIALEDPSGRSGWACSDECLPAIWKKNGTGPTETVKKAFRDRSN